MINIYMSQNQEAKFKNFIYSIANKYIKIKNLDVTVNQVVNAIYNDKYILNLIKNKNADFSNISVSDFAKNHKRGISNSSDKFKASKYDNVVKIDFKKLEKQEELLIDSVRLIFFNTFEKDHFNFFEVVFSGSICKDETIESFVFTDGIKIPVLFYLQYLLIKDSNFISEKLEYIGDEKEIIEFNSTMQQIIVKNIKNQNDNVNPIYIKYIYKRSLFITCAFYDLNQKKTHIFSTKLRSEHLTNKQSINTLINNTINEFYKHLGIKVNFNGAIDLIKLLQIYVSILSSDLKSALITDLFNINDKCKKFIIKLHQIFLEDQNWQPELVNEYDLTGADESDIIYKADNQYMSGVPIQIKIFSKDADTLIPINMKNIIIPSFIGYQSMVDFPQFGNADSSSSSYSKRSAFCSINGQNVTYAHPLYIYGNVSGSSMVLTDVKENEV